MLGLLCWAESKSTVTMPPFPAWCGVDDLGDVSNACH
jgi:hypothetical protein